MFISKRKKVITILTVILLLVCSVPLDGAVAFAAKRNGQVYGDVEDGLMEVPNVSEDENMVAQPSEETDAKEEKIQVSDSTQEEVLTPLEEEVLTPLEEENKPDSMLGETEETKATEEEMVDITNMPEESTEQDNLLEEPSLSSDLAPKDYEGDNTFLEKAIHNRMSLNQVVAAGKKVLLIEDRNPWNSLANQTILGGLTEYKKVTTANFLEEDLSQYAVIVFANDQPFNTYSNYAAFKEYLEIFASIGGVIVFGACDAGWAGGQLNEAIPGNVTKENHYEARNYIDDLDHPIVTGILTSNDTLTDEDLVSQYCSHISFHEKTLPPGTNVILRDSTTKQPTLIEYPLGKGRVIATGLTFEHNYNYRGRTINGVLVGDFAKCLDDIFAYAIRISNIDVEELKLLKEWRLKKNAHSIIVADGSSQNGGFAAIAGTNVKVGLEDYISDENGQVLHHKWYGMNVVSVSAPGYRERKLMYDIQERTSRIFFLDKVKDDGRPYITQVQGSRNLDGWPLDLRDHAINFTENSLDLATIIVDGDWNGHENNQYILYQDPVGNEKGRYVTSKNSIFILSPGLVFEPNRPVKLKMIAKDGVESEAIKIKMTIKKAASQGGGAKDSNLQEGLHSFDWIGSHPVKSDNDIFTKLLTSDMSISSEVIPIEIAMEHNEDGTITYKGVIGFASGDATKNILHSKKDQHKFDGGIWEDFKDEIKRYKRAGSPKEYFNKLKKKYGRDWHATKLRATFDVELNACGYMDVKVDQYGKVISSEGGIIIDGSGDFTLGQTFMAGPVPIYYELVLGVGAEVNLGVEFYNGEEGGLGFRPTYNGVTLELPHLTLEGGVGVRGVATLGIQGNGTLEVNFKFNGDTEGVLNLDGGIRAKVIFVVDYKWDFASVSIPLWPKERMARSFALSQLAQEEAQISLASRDYLADTTPWNGSSNRAMVPMAADVSPMIQTLQEGVMPDALPQIHKVGDQLLMLFIRDVADRKPGNHTQLVYSLYNGTSWTEPKAVWESETADFFYKSTVYQDNLYVSWQKLKSVASKDTAEELLAEVAENSEICIAKWNGECLEFENQQFITNDNNLDMYATIAANDKELSVIWVSNSANDPTGASGNYIIKSVNVSEDKISSIKEHYTTSEYITELNAAYLDSKLQIMYTILEDNEDKSNVYYLKNGTSVEVKSEHESASLQFEDGAFLWQSNGVVYQYKPSTSELIPIVAGEKGNISSSYHFVSNGTKTALVWYDNSEVDHMGMIKASILSNGSWSRPIVLLDQLNLNLSYMDVELLENGEFAMVMNTSTYDPMEGVEKTALVFAKVEPCKDLALTFAMVEKANEDQTTQPVIITLTNLGDSVVTSAQFHVYSGEAEYANKALSLSLNPGDSITLTETIDISNIDTVSNMTAVVTLGDDRNISNNSQEITVGQVDISLEVDAYDLGDTLVFALSARNESKTIAHSAIRIIEDSPNGIVLDVKNIGEVSREDTVLYLYEIDKSLVTFDEMNQKVYFFKIDSLEEDWNPEDNQGSYVIYGNLDDGDVNEEGLMEEYVIVPATSLDISQKELNFKSSKSESVQLLAKIQPENASIQYVKWYVDNPEIAYVDSTGLVTPLRTGVTKLTAVTAFELMDTITIRVGDDSEPTVPTDPVYEFPPFIDDRLPRILNSDITGWPAIANQLKNNQRDTTILMNDSTVVAKEIFQAIKDKNINLTFVQNNQWEWIINGKNLSAEDKDFAFRDLDLSIDLKSDNIKESLLAEYDSYNYCRLALSDQYDDRYSWTIRVALANLMEGKYAHLFCYDQETDQLTLVDVSLVDEEGYAKLQLSKGLDYVILGSDKILLDQALKEIIVTPESETLYVKGTTGFNTNMKIELPQVIRKLLEENVCDVVVSCSSSNRKVAIVSKKGKVTAKLPGKTKIVTKIKVDGIEVVFEHTITVKEAYIKLTKACSNMKIGDTFTFKAVGYGIDTKDIVYLTSYRSKLVINKKTGKAIAKSKGTDYVLVKVGKLMVKHKVVIE